MLLGGGVWALSSSWTPQPPPVTALDFIVTDADALVMVRLSDLLHSKPLQEIYDLAPAAVRQQSEQYSESIGMNLDDVEQVTLSMRSPLQPKVCAVIQLRRPYDRARRERILEAFPKSTTWTEQKYRDLTYQSGMLPEDPTGTNEPLAIYNHDDQLYVIGNEAGVQAALDHYLDSRPRRGLLPFTTAAPPAHEERPLDEVRPFLTSRDYVAVFGSAMTQRIQDVIPQGTMMSWTPLKQVSQQAIFKDLAESISKFERSIGTLSFEKDKILKVEIRTRFPTPGDAQKIQKTMSTFLAGLKLFPEGMAGDTVPDPRFVKVANDIEAFLRSIEVEVRESELEMQASLNLAELTELAKTVVPDQTSEIWNERFSSRDKLLELAAAMEQYRSDRGHYPPAIVMDASGRIPLYSWRVELLPYLGEEAQKLYEEFHRDEPWNSPHNQALSQRMPPVFEHPAARAMGQRTHAFPGLERPQGITSFKLPVNELAAFHQGRKPTRDTIADGPERTIMLVERQPFVPWTATFDLDVSSDPAQLRTQLLEHLGGSGPEVVEVLLFDGTFRRLPADFDPKVLWHALTPADGKGLPPE